MPQRLSPWRVPAHVTLFAGYHLWSPWLIPTRCLAVLPLAYIAVRTRDVRIGILTHVVFNAADLVALLLFIRTHALTPGPGPADRRSPFAHHFVPSDPNRRRQPPWQTHSTNPLGPSSP